MRLVRVVPEKDVVVGCIEFNYNTCGSDQDLIGAAASVRLLFLVAIPFKFVSRISIPFYDIICLLFTFHIRVSVM